MSESSGKLKSKVWTFPTMGSWHFLSVPKKVSAKIKVNFAGMTAGFGSLPVEVTIGNTSWKTSIFPDTKTKTYLVPLKAKVRKDEGITPETTVIFSIRILV